MFKNKLSINKYSFLITLCILINLLESWYFGLNWQAESVAESICDLVTAIPIVIISFWFVFSNNDYKDVIKGQFIMFILVMIYGIAYKLLLV